MLNLDLEEANKRNKPLQQFQSIFNLGRGVVYWVVAYFVLITPEIKYRFGKTTVIIFCSLVFVYGAFRIYRSIVDLIKTLKR